MDQIADLRKAINTTRNFWIFLFLRFLNGKRTAHFRNGIKAELGLSEYKLIIGLLERLRKESFAITKSNERYFFKNRNAGFSFQARSLETAPSLLELALSLYSEDWVVEQTDVAACRFQKKDFDCLVQKLDDDLFTLKFERFEITAPYDSIWVYFFECVNGVYGWNFDGKVVLDVGGYCGESAVFFWSQGAKKIVIYEPVPEHMGLLKENMIRNNVSAEIYNEGIGEKDCIEAVRYDSANVGFGLIRKGRKQLEVKIRSVARVIEASGADIGKFDCEGAETSLLNVSESILRKIDFYIIEAHSTQIRNAIVGKFTRSGFKQAQPPKKLLGDVSVLYFEKEP